MYIIHWTANIWEIIKGGSQTVIRNEPPFILEQWYQQIVWNISSVPVQVTGDGSLDNARNTVYSAMRGFRAAEYCPLDNARNTAYSTMRAERGQITRIVTSSAVTLGWIDRKLQSSRLLSLEKVDGRIREPKSRSKVHAATVIRIGDLAENIWILLLVFEG